MLKLKIIHTNKDNIESYQYEFVTIVNLYQNEKGTITLKTNKNTLKFENKSSITYIDKYLNDCIKNFTTLQIQTVEVVKESNGKPYVDIVAVSAIET